MHELYHGPECKCGCNTKGVAQLAAGDINQNVLKAALKAFEKLFKRKGYQPEDLGKVKEYKQLIEATNAVLKPAVQDNVVEGTLRKALEEDVFLFSGLKTHAQLFEASRLLTDDRGQRKSFAAFERDFQRLQSTYNSSWLEAEFNYSNAAATAADRWSRLDEDENFVLQYRTADDERVRQSHEKLHNTTLPKSDPFWDSYYPPNGWNCRCIAIEVRPGKHKLSDPVEAAQKGEKATTQLGKGGVNKAAIFRFNPGKRKVIFPPKHPYRKVQGAQLAVEELLKQGNVAAAKKLIIEQKREVYSKPLQNQYSSVFNTTKGGKVEVHELVDLRAEDYKDVLNAAKAIAREGKIVKIQPIIDRSEILFRGKIYPGLTSKTSNPDLLIDGRYIDVKRPKAIKNITGNANGASKQGAEVLISDARLNLDDNIINKRAAAILNENNREFYGFDRVHFLNKGKVVTIKNTTTDE